VSGSHRGTARHRRPNRRSRRSPPGRGLPAARPGPALPRARRQAAARRARTRPSRPRPASWRDPASPSPTASAIRARVPMRGGAFERACEGRAGEELLARSGNATSVAGVALLQPLVATVVVAERLPEPGLVAVLDAQAAEPLGALPEVARR